MSTRINVDVNGFVALKQQADKVAQLNQQSAVKRQESEKLTKAQRLQRSREKFRELVNGFRTKRAERVAKANGANVKPQQPVKASAGTTQSKNSKGADRNDVPSNKLIRELSAQRNPSGWGILTVDWLPNTINELYYTTGVFGETITNSANVVTQRSIRLSLTKSSDALSTPSTQVYSTTESAPAFDNLFSDHHTNGAINTISGNRSLPVLDGSGLFGRDFYGRANSETAIGGNTYYTAAPVTASSGSTLYGCLQTFFLSGTPGWTLRQGGSRFFPNGIRCVSLFVYFKYDTRTASLQFNSSFVLDLVPDSLTNQTPILQAIASHMPGGTTWIQQYVENTFSGDPSIAIRSAGYRGDYHVKNSKAYFLRYNFASGSISAAARRGLRVFGGLEWQGYEITSSGSGLVAELTSYYIGLTGQVVDVKSALGDKDTQKYGEFSERELSAMLSKFASEYPDGSYASQAGPLLYPLVTPP